MVLGCPGCVPGPFSNILDWHRAIARWDDLVSLTSIEPSTESADSGRVSAAGDITLVVLATGVTVRAVLRLAYMIGRELRLSYEVGGTTDVTATDVEEVVALIVSRARRVKPPPAGKYKRRRP